MSFLADKKREHESQAEAELAEKDYARAFFHTAKAAEYGFKLAEQTEGLIAERYVDDAYDLIEIAEVMKAKAARQSKDNVRRVIKEGPDEDGRQPSAWELREKPGLKLDEVAGLAEVKEILREKVILPFQHPDVYRRFKTQAGAGVLMYGPPGNGKTYVARAIAGELDAAFFPVDASQIKDKYVGETEKHLTSLFEEARGHERSVLFIDEADHLLSKRGNRKIGAVAQFLTLADGLTKNDNCLLILAATNKPWLLDEAVIRPGRLGTHIYVGLPDAKAREAICARLLVDVPVSPDVSFAQITAQTDGYSGADIVAVCDRAKLAAILRQLTSGRDEVVTTEDFAAALDKVRPSVVPSQLAEFERWRDSRQKPPDADDGE